MFQPFTPYILPFVAALVVAGLARLLGGPGRGAATGGAAVGMAFLVTWVVQRGWPSAPSLNAPSTLLPYIALVGIGLGLASTLLGLHRRGAVAVAAVAAALAVWLLLGAPSRAGWPLLLQGLALWSGWMVALWRLTTRPVSEPTAAIMLMAAAIGVGLVPLMSDQTALSRPALIIAAAAAGLLPWSLFLGLPFLAAAVLGGGGTLLAVGTLSAQHSIGTAAAMAVLLLVFFADQSAARLALGSGLVRRLTAPLGLLLAAALPVGLALLIAYVAARLPNT